MRFEVDVSGRIRRVTLEKTNVACRFRVTIDGVTRLVDAAQLGNRAWSLLLPEEDGASWRATISEGADPGALLIQVGGTSVPVSLNGRRSRHSSSAGNTSAGGPQRIAAMMPGKVVRVLVAPGDEVVEGQSVVVVEAMKMENEFRAQKPGTVKEVAVRPGSSVEAGKVLVVIE